MPHACVVAAESNRSWLKTLPPMAGNARSSATSARCIVLSKSSPTWENPSRGQRHPTNEERSIWWSGGSGESAPGTRSLSRGPPEALWGVDQVAHGSRRREATRAQLPLTSSITLEERKRGPNDAAHQSTSRPTFRPAGLYG